jgi:hypothetical protein
MITSFQRLIAITLLIIPGALATFGFLWMKDALFVQFTPAGFPWLKFLGGLVSFSAGVAFIAGWIFYRDRKRNYVAPRFREKKKPRKEPQP